MVADGIMASVDRLALFPRSGRVVPEIGDEAVREILYRGYRIMHIVSGDEGDEEIKILTVVHSSLPFGDVPEDDE